MKPITIDLMDEYPLGKLFRYIVFSQLSLGDSGCVPSALNKTVFYHQPMLTEVL